MTKARFSNLGAVVAPALLAIVFYVPGAGATLVYRADGHSCYPSQLSADALDVNAYTGPSVSSGTSGGFFTCPVPGYGTMYYSSGNINQVNVRLKTTGTTGMVVKTFLFAHDYDSTDFDICDTDSDTSNADPDFFAQSLYWDTSGGTCADAGNSNYPVLVHVETDGYSGRTVAVKLLSVYR